MMALQTFRTYHPALYERGLVVALILTLFAGLNPAIFHQHAKRSLFDPPSSAVATDGPHTSQPVASQSSTATQSMAIQATILPLSDGTYDDPKLLGQKINAAWFGDAHWPALDKLWSRESGWNPGSRNRFSGACGIPQALPCSKIPDHTTKGQIEWGLQYIQGRYGNPTAAWRHSQAYGWY